MPTSDTMFLSSFNHSVAKTKPRASGVNSMTGDPFPEIDFIHS